MFWEVLLSFMKIQSTNLSGDILSFLSKLRISPERYSVFFIKVEYEVAVPKLKEA